jgi:hypothetical protein
MKDTITLEGRIFDCTKLVLQRYGLDDRKAIETQLLATRQQ